MSIDEALASFLANQTEEVPFNYKRLVNFVLRYRDFLRSSLHCPHKACARVSQAQKDKQIATIELSQRPQEAFEDAQLTMKAASSPAKHGLRHKMDSPISSECIPDHCNEFILKYCADEARKKSIGEPKSWLIRQTEKMSTWLYDNGFTLSRLVRF